eukprot:266766-Chlamydomonas_euryale.AAC.1
MQPPACPHMQPPACPHMQQAASQACNGLHAHTCNHACMRPHDAACSPLRMSHFAESTYEYVRKRRACRQGGSGRGELAGREGSKEG